MSGLVVRNARLAAAVIAALLAVAGTVAIAARPAAAAASERMWFAHTAGAVAVADPPSQIAAPTRAGGATLTGIVAPAWARSRAGRGAHVWFVGVATVWSGEPQVLLVLGSREYRGRQWLRVLLPIRPNDTSGWIPRNNAVLIHTAYWVTVDKTARTVAVYRHGKLVHLFDAVIGKPATPTPDGLAAIYEIDRQPDPNGFLGTWALPLTAFSNVLFNFGGGPGRVAIHGRGGASLIDPLGSAASHGCVRIDDGSIAWMARHLPQGTPVQITG